MADANKAKMVEMLQALASSDKAVRAPADNMYQQARRSDTQNLIVSLLAVVGAADVDESSRSQAAVLLRQFFVQRTETAPDFALVAPEYRQQVATELLRLLEQEPSKKVQRKVGDVVAAVAALVCDEDKVNLNANLVPGQVGWPALLPVVFRLANPAQNSDAVRCEVALRLVRDVVETLHAEIVAAQALLGTTLQAALASPERSIRTAASLLVLSIVQTVESDKWESLLPTTPVLVQLMKQLADANEDELLVEVLEAFIDTAAEEPDFFKAELKGSNVLASTLVTLAKTPGVEEGVRKQVLEFMTVMIEKRAKYLSKHLVGFIQQALEVCMELMVQGVEDGDAELKSWMGRDEDEEGEEDQDELFHMGEESLDRIANAVKAEVVMPSLFQLIGVYVQRSDWQAKHAALAAVKQTIEYVEDNSSVEQSAELLANHVNHDHPRVRYIALHAICQLSADHTPQFQESSHKTVMPLLLGKLEDSVDRVASMAMSAFASFAEGLDTSLMGTYAHAFMERLVAKLQSTAHRGVREEAITAIAVIAGVLEEDFKAYYDGIMPLLKQAVMHATGEKEGKLRGKAFECLSLLGLAVGKEKFLPDAQDAIAEMLKTPTEADDLQREYISEASERICVCLKRDFAPFLPALFPRILKGLDLTEGGGEGAAAAGEENCIDVKLEGGRIVKVHTAKFEEANQAMSLVQTLCKEMEGSFYDAIPETAKALLPIFSAGDEFSILSDDARGMALDTWALLIKAARAGGREKGLSNPPELCAELLMTAVQKTLTMMEVQGTDMETLTSYATGLRECIKNAESQVLSAAQLLELTGKIFNKIDDSSRTITEAATKKAAKATSPTQALVDEEGDEVDPASLEEAYMKSLEDVLGALMKVGPEAFTACREECGQRMQKWFATPRHRTLATWMACDLLEHLKEESQALWPIFMPEVLKAVTDEDADLRTCGCYAVNLAALFPAFASAAPGAFRMLAGIVGTTKPRKRDESAKIAFDNAVAALLNLAVHQAAHCPPEVQAWPLLLSKLPLREDHEEAQKVHAKLAQLVIDQHAGVLGENLGRTLSILLEAYHVEEICNKETDAKIKSVFQMIDQGMLKGLAPNFSEKQMRKLEKMLAATA